MFRTWFVLLFIILGIAVSAAPPAPLQTYTVKDYIGHAWVDEVVHFAFDVKTTAKEFTLTDGDGAPLPTQVADVQRKDGRVTGTVWTVVSLAPGAELTLALRPGKPATPAPSALLLKAADGQYILANERMSVLLPIYPGALPAPKSLTALPAPLGAARTATGAWMGGGSWVNGGPDLQVTAATTTVKAQGPVRVIIEQALTFPEDKYYRATITLGVRQDAITVVEESNIDAPKAALRYSLNNGLNPTRVIWHNQWKKTDHAESWSLTQTDVDYTKDNVVCKLRPWSFWWLGDITEWAGAYRPDGDLLGILALHPSTWSPDGWDGADRTEAPITAGPNGRLDVTLGLLAYTRKNQDGTTTFLPLHREWALTAGTAADHVLGEGTRLLRKQLIKYSEFPLDTVKDFAFDYTPSQKVPAAHPYLLFTPAEIERARKQAKELPGVKAEVDAAVNYIINACGSYTTLQKEGWQAYYTKNFIGNGQVEKLPIAYIGSDDPRLAEILAAATKGVAQNVVDTFIEKPSRPAIGAYGPWFSETMTTLLCYYDMAAGTGKLTADEDRAIRAILVLGAHILAHPDYWNTGHGLCSANPNMTSSIYLPKGLLGLYMDGHPEAAQWRKDGEAEFKDELKGWIFPGGAWIENPGYQSASLDGMFLLAQALKNVTGEDYFADPQFKATMDYYGFLLTPPDRRFPPGAKDNPTPPMVQPSIGDMFSGYRTCYNGWMACQTAKSDPDYSARQQFYWRAQGNYYGMAGRAKGLLLALSDPTLPEKTPAELSKGFPGFGSLLRTSWTDPKATYLCHRTGETVHHYHADHGEIVFYAKGAPLVTDFGNCYEPLQRGEPWWHNKVSFDKADSPAHYGGRGTLTECISLPHVIDYSIGTIGGGGNQKDTRSMVLVKSADPMGANYAVLRDATVDGQPNQKFYYNLFCLAGEPQIANNVVHFPGQNGVDLDVHFLSPVAPQFEKDTWKWRQQIYVWGWFDEEQHGIRAMKQGSAEDYVTVLYPRAPGQAAAQILTLAGGAAARIQHMEGVDVVLLSPGKPVDVDGGNIDLSGEVAYARVYQNGAVRLAVVKGKGRASAGGWTLDADGPAAVEIKGKAVVGETSGSAHEVTVSLPAGYGAPVVLMDGKPVTVKRNGDQVIIPAPAGEHTFTITAK